jgi:hypothetical protein
MSKQRGSLHAGVAWPWRHRPNHRWRLLAHILDERMLEKAGGMCVLFTDGSAKLLNNTGVGFKDKAMLRFQEQGTDSVLYREAMAVLEIMERRPDFKAYIAISITHTTHHRATGV